MPETLHQIEKAERMVALLNREETEGWSYKATPVSDRYAKIEVFDDEGILVGHL